MKGTTNTYNIYGTICLPVASTLWDERAFVYWYLNKYSKWFRSCFGSDGGRFWFYCVYVVKAVHVAVLYFLSNAQLTLSLFINSSNSCVFPYGDAGVEGHWPVLCAAPIAPQFCCLYCVSDHGSLCGSEHCCFGVRGHSAVVKTHTYWAPISVFLPALYEFLLLCRHDDACLQLPCPTVPIFAIWTFICPTFQGSIRRCSFAYHSVCITDKTCVVGKKIRSVCGCSLHLFWLVF